MQSVHQDKVSVNIVSMFDFDRQVDILLEYYHTLEYSAMIDSMTQVNIVNRIID